MAFKHLIILLFILLQSINTFAINKDKNTDTTIVSSDIAKIQIANNLDSLLNLWYVQTSLKITSNLPDLNILSDTTSIPYFSDSVYRDRVYKMCSPINLVYNDQVQSFIDMYLKRHRNQVEVMLGLTDYYFPMFEEILDSYNIPLEFKYLPIIESALNPRAISRAGASGIWQFMYSTGKLYDLKVTSFVDERQNPVKATHAAAQYLRDLYDIYHDWTLVIAAYNCGPGNVNKAINRSNGKTDFWEIYKYLPKETRGYVPAFIAANYVMTYYKEHNILPRKIDYPYAVDTVIITRQLHLQQVSEVLNIPMQQLRDLNPQYKKDIIPSIDDTFPLMLPSDCISKFINLKDSIFSYKDSIFFYNKKKSSIYSLQNSSMDKLYYIVKSNDKLSTIADEYNVSVNDLKAWNTISKNYIRKGQKLIIYLPKDKAVKYKTSDLNQSLQKDKQVNNNISSSSSSVTDNSDYIYYKVKSGDCLWTISQKFPGTTNSDIMKLNNLKNSHTLMPGQVIKIKRK